MSGAYGPRTATLDFLLLQDCAQTCRTRCGGHGELQAYNMFAMASSIDPFRNSGNEARLQYCRGELALIQLVDVSTLAIALDAPEGVEDMYHYLAHISYGIIPHLRRWCAFIVLFYSSFHSFGTDHGQTLRPLHHVWPSEVPRGGCEGKPAELAFNPSVNEPARSLLAFDGPLCALSSCAPVLRHVGMRLTARPSPTSDTTPNRLSQWLSRGLTMVRR
jgi:hypothetical protein